MQKGLEEKQVGARTIISLSRGMIAPQLLQGTPGENEREEVECQKEDEREEGSSAGSDLGWE